MFIKCSLHCQQDMRTKKERTSEWGGTMPHTVKFPIFRDYSHLVGDILGAAALWVLLLVALHLPLFF